MENKTLQEFADELARENGHYNFRQLEERNRDCIEIIVGELSIAAERYAAHVAEQAIEKTIEVIDKYTKENCDDHTPYYGACVTCGSIQNWDVITDIEEMRHEIEALKINKD